MNRHAHIVMRGIAGDGSDLVMRREFIDHEMRRIAEDLATRHMGQMSQRELDAHLAGRPSGNGRASAPTTQGASDARGRDTAMSDFSLGQILTNPEPFVQATRLWIESNAALLAGCRRALWRPPGFRVRCRRMIDRVRQSAEDGAGTAAQRKPAGRPAAQSEAGVFRHPHRADRPKRLCWVDQEPVLVTGGTRSGKGVGVIRPACLTYGGPMVMYDGGKGELFRDTSG